MFINRSSRFEALFWKLFNAESEEVLHRLVSADSLLTRAENWYPYGGKNADDRSNFGTFENQQPSPIPALVEKITNSIDSILMKHCQLEGIDPKSSDAPRSMEEAVDRYFAIKNLDFSEAGDRKRREIAENIQIVATGDRETPNLMIYDNGEGQRPEDFANTFLSLHRNNKTDIHFVQGKYNMGSTGAVVFCGRRHRYQLIASKRNDGLISDGRPNNLGFTLVRRHPLTDEEEERYRSSWYEYLLIDGEIPSFPIREIDIGLSKGKPFVTGSIVKLYSYQLPRGSRSDVTLDLWRELNQYLYQPALPLLVVERRFGRADKSDPKHESKMVLGNRTRIIIDDRDKKEQTLSLQIMTAEIGKVDIEATVFKHDVERKEFIKDKAVVFTMNGQVHGFLGRRFISEDLGFSMLRDSLLIQVDCTHIRTSFRQNLFMANRSNLKEGNELQELIDAITQKLKSDDTLRRLNQDRKNRILRDNRADEDMLKSLISSIPLDKDLINLLKKDGSLDAFKSISRLENEGMPVPDPKPPFVSKRFPSFFRSDLKEDKFGKRVKSIPLNGRGIITFETDAENEYLFRPDEQGSLQIQILGPQPNDVTGGTDKGKPKKVEDIFDVSISGPSEGAIKVLFEPKGQNQISVGDEIEISARLSSPSGDLESIFYVKIVDPQKPQERAPEEKPLPPSLPTPIRVFETAQSDSDRTWKDFDMTGGDIVKVIRGDDENVIDGIAINMDSFILKRFISKNRIRNETGIRNTKDKYFASVYLHSLFLYGIFDKLKKSEEETSYDLGDLEELIPKIMQPYSSFLLYKEIDNAVISSLNED